MVGEKTTFALFFGNRGVFPPEVVGVARKELPATLKQWGYDTLMLDEAATGNGGVETVKEGEIYANFLRANRGKFGGIIVCLPNFGDENGAVAALKGAEVPILVQAYPDDKDKMGVSQRRDAFCGKLSVMDVFCQNEIPFTALKPHVVKPSSDRFKDNVVYFDQVCRVVNGIKGMVVGAIGARSTPFKTVRIDELALQRHQITVETIDLTDVLGRMKAQSAGDDGYKAKAETLRQMSSWKGVPEKAFDNLVRLGLTLDDLIDEYAMDAIGLRCWTELQMQVGISPCVLMGELNERAVAAACEVDIGNAVMMKALALASGQPAGCLDWNNNYDDEDDKCILFHCGPIPPSLMAGRGTISDHGMLARITGPGCGYGCNTGRIGPADITFGSLATEAGKVKVFLGQGRITDDEIPADFFGCAGVAQIDKLQDVLIYIGKNGHRHHVSLAKGSVETPVKEAFEKYLGFDVDIPQRDAAAV